MSTVQIGKTRVIGVENMMERLEQAGENIKKAVFEEIKSGAEDIQQDAKQRVPVDTGDLRDSIKVVASEKAILARVWADYPKSGRKIKHNTQKARAGSPVYYAYVIEYGTKTRMERPFFFPAVVKNSYKIKDAIKAKVKEAARDA